MHVRRLGGAQHQLKVLALARNELAERWVRHRPHVDLMGQQVGRAGARAGGGRGTRDGISNFLSTVVAAFTHDEVDQGGDVRSGRSAFAAE